MNLQDIMGLTAPRQQAPQDNNSLGLLMQFLQQGKTEAPQMQPVHMEDHSNDAFMQYAAQRQNEAEKLKAHREQLISDAKELSGKGRALTTDPQVQAMIDSGNPQEVALGMKLAEEYKNKQIASQYNENPTYAKYQQLLAQNTPESLAEAERMMTWRKATGTNISMGDKFSDNGKQPLTDAQLDVAHIPRGTVAYYDKDGIPKPIDVSNTEAEGKAALHADAIDSALGGYMDVLNSVTALPNFTKNSLLSDVSNMGIPGVSNIALRNMAPEYQELDSRRALLIQAIEKEFSGAAGTKKEDVDYAISLVPNPHTDPTVQKAVYARLQNTLSAMRTKAGTAYTKMQGPYSNLITPEMQQDGFANIVGKVENPGMDPSAVSPKGAFGLAQTMPGTFREMMPDGDPRNPQHQLEAGHRYWKQGLAESNGDLKRAAAYYQGGPDGAEAYDRGVYHSDGNLNTKQYGDKAFGPSPGPRKDRVKHPIVEAVTKNSPANKAAQKQAEEDAAILKLYGL